MVLQYITCEKVLGKNLIVINNVFTYELLWYLTIQQTRDTFSCLLPSAGGRLLGDSISKLIDHLRLIDTDSDLTKVNWRLASKLHNSFGHHVCYVSWRHPYLTCQPQNIQWVKTSNASVIWCNYDSLLITATIAGRLLHMMCVNHVRTCKQHYMQCTLWVKKTFPLYFCR